MKTAFSRLVLALASAALAAAPSFVWGAPPAPKGPASKVYVAEVKGDSQVQTGDKIYPPEETTAFVASGAIIETKAKSHDALVYSNGTGLFVDENSRVEITRFVQEDFQPDPNGLLASANEPSVSQSNVHVARGAVGICTNQLISGSTMIYTTPLATINIRGGRLSIQANPDVTIVDLLEGDITVRRTSGDVGGQILKPGERAVVRAGADVTIEPIPHDDQAIADRRVEMSCQARRSVTFGVLDRKPTVDGASDEAAGAEGDQQIVAQPTVPSQTPDNIVISPDRLPGT